VAGEPGTANTGGGGGCNGQGLSGGNGGPGFVVLEEQAGSFSQLNNTGGRWSLQAQFLYKKAGNWTS
jgi:hypothetical protein